MIWILKTCIPKKKHNWTRSWHLQEITNCSFWREPTPFCSLYLSFLLLLVSLVQYKWPLQAVQNNRLKFHYRASKVNMISYTQSYPSIRNSCSTKADKSSWQWTNSRQYRISIDMGIHMPFRRGCTSFGRILRSVEDLCTAHWIAEQRAIFKLRILNRW